jgi:hypothetical protein
MFGHENLLGLRSSRKARVERDYGLIWAIRESLAGKPCAAMRKTLIQPAWGL